MEELLKDLKRFSDKLDDIVKEETEYSTFEDLLNQDTDVFAKEIDKVISKLKEDRKKSKEEKIEEGVKEVEKFKAKNGVVEKRTGTMFKVYETEKDGHSGVCIEARGDIMDILHYATKGMGEILREHDFTIDDLDGLTKAFRSTIKRELLKEEK